MVFEVLGDNLLTLIRCVPFLQWEIKGRWCSSVFGGAERVHGGDNLLMLIRRVLVQRALREGCRGDVEGLVHQ